MRLKLTKYKNWETKCNLIREQRRINGHTMNKAGEREKNEKPKKHIQASIITLIKLLKKIQREK